MGRREHRPYWDVVPAPLGTRGHGRAQGVCWPHWEKESRHFTSRMGDTALPRGQNGGIPLSSACWVSPHMWGLVFPFRGHAPCTLTREVKELCGKRQGRRPGCWRPRALERPFFSIKIVSLYKRGMLTSGGVTVCDNVLSGSSKWEFHSGEAGVDRRDGERGSPSQTLLGCGIGVSGALSPLGGVLGGVGIWGRGRPSQPPHWVGQ